MLIQGLGQRIWSLGEERHAEQHYDRPEELWRKALASGRLRTSERQGRCFGSPRAHPLFLPHRTRGDHTPRRAGSAKGVMAPQGGLAPGFVAIVGGLSRPSSSSACEGPHLRNALVDRVVDVRPLS